VSCLLANNHILADQDINFVIAKLLDLTEDNKDGNKPIPLKDLTTHKKGTKCFGSDIKKC